LIITREELDMVTKIDKMQKEMLQTIYPPMVGDIDPEEHIKRMRVLQMGREKLERGEKWEPAKDLLATETTIATVRATEIVEEEKINKVRRDRIDAKNQEKLANQQVIVDTLPSEVEPSSLSTVETPV
jgi:hypothetical protein